MSTNATMLSPDDSLEAFAPVMPRTARVAGLIVVVSWAVSLVEIPMPAVREAPRHHAMAGPVAAAPEVYCVRHGAEHAGAGFAPCSALGCRGCAATD